MSYRELLPHPALRPHVDRLWQRTPEGESPGAASRILPDGCIDILVDVASGEARVVGTMTRAVTYAPSSQSLVAVRFKPGCAAGFLRVPAEELTDRAVSARELGLRWLEPLPASPRGHLVSVKAGASSQPGGREWRSDAALAALEWQLLTRLDSLCARQEVRYGARRLFAAQPPSVQELARELGQSRQQLARTFRRELGISPKQLGRVARLQRAIDHLQRGPSGSLAQQALELGYYDQAHMARDFRALAGITPAEAQRSAGSIFPIPSLWLEP